MAAADGQPLAHQEQDARRTNSARGRRRRDARVRARAATGAAAGLPVGDDISPVDRDGQRPTHDPAALRRPHAGSRGTPGIGHGGPYGPGERDGSRAGRGGNSRSCRGRDL